MYTATTLGYHFRVNAQTMNRILLKLGYLEGRPGSYSVTEMAKPYVTVYDHGMGTNRGYSKYNVYYEVTCYDESIIEELDKKVTPELIDEVKKYTIEKIYILMIQFLNTIHW